MICGARTRQGHQPCRRLASDDLLANAARIGQITSLLEPIAHIAEALHATFADFDATLRTNDGSSRIGGRPGWPEASECLRGILRGCGTPVGDCASIDESAE